MYGAAWATAIIAASRSMRNFITRLHSMVQGSVRMLDVELKRIRLEN